MITQEHWDNFDRLVAHLERLPEEKFDYFMGVPTDGCGCVAAHVRMLWHLSMYDQSDDKTLLMDTLGITRIEAEHIWAPRLYGRAEGFGETPAECLVQSPARVRHALLPEGPFWDPFRAVGNKADALRRLAVLAARYVRPSSVFVADEAAFLASVRTRVAQPRVAVTD